MVFSSGLRDRRRPDGTAYIYVECRAGGRLRPAAPNAASTEARIPAAGTYTLTLTVTDGVESGIRWVGRDRCSLPSTPLRTTTRNPIVDGCVLPPPMSE